MILTTLLAKTHFPFLFPFINSRQLTWLTWCVSSNYQHSYIKVLYGCSCVQIWQRSSWILMQESDDLCRRLRIHQEIWGGQLWGETDYSDQWSTPGNQSQPLFVSVIQLLLLPNENKDSICNIVLFCLFCVFQCAKTFLNLMAHISKEQTVQYILTLIDDTLQVQRDPVCAAKCTYLH